MISIQCAQCFMIFAIPDSFHATAMRMGPAMDFYCPAGHKQHFAHGPTQVETLRAARDRLKQQMARVLDEVAAAKREAEHERHRANGYKGAARKIRKRVQAGVCPCCNRTFSNLARHMAAKHPEHDGESHD